MGSGSKVKRVLSAVLVLSAIVVSTARAHAEPSRSIELILDASGSMNARLDGGTTKLTAAKSAVEEILGQLDGNQRLAFRAYGHQSPRQKHDCSDTQLLVDFGSVGDVRSQVSANTRTLKAQGYTPITRVLGRAADDLKKEGTTEHVVILVSDGKETCDGDPCATARKLKAAHASLVVHTVGFGVDDATRLQLQCIAGQTGGRYFSAQTADELVDQVNQAAAAPLELSDMKRHEESGSGGLEVKNPSMLGHNVLDATSSKKVATISSFKKRVDLPAGIYHVQFGRALWKSVEVTADEITVIDPATLVIENPDLSGHEVRDSETGEVIASLNTSLPRSVLVPSTYDVTFNGTVWKGVRLSMGTTTTLRPGVIQMKSGNAVVLDANGKVVAKVSSLDSRASLAPGKYTVRANGKKIPVTLTEGKIVDIGAQ